MRSAIIKRSVIVNGHRTSVSVEDAFWTELKFIARAKGVSLSDLITSIDRGKEAFNLSSALRVFVLRQCREATENQSVRAPTATTTV
jgi:predicted DNA-binding ribbon-helix-helix protein